MFFQTTKCGRFIKAKTEKFHKLFIKNYNLSWQEVRVLVKQGLVGHVNGCIVTRGDLDTIRLQLAAASKNTILRMVGGVLEFDIVQEIQVLSDAGMCLKPHPEGPLGSILDA